MHGGGITGDATFVIICIRVWAGIGFLGVYMKESDFQATVIHWLRAKKCFVWKCAENATTQRGVADIFFCFEGFYGWLEVKKSRNAPKRPGQQAFIDKMDEWSWAKFVYPENWEEVKKELTKILR